MKNTTILRDQSGQELAIVGRIRRHSFAGIDPTHCAKCGHQFASVSHK